MKAVRARLVRTSLCDCGARTVWEGIEVGKEYKAFPETMHERGWMCVKCGQHHRSPVIMVDDGVKPPGVLFAGLFEFDEGLA